MKLMIALAALLLVSACTSTPPPPRRHRLCLPGRRRQHEASRQTAELEVHHALQGRGQGVYRFEPV